ncbi:hypothetical protein, partial [Aeromonas tecta]|uniref:hypothetical protein n=1 Tax=Aeromonas tecta TaxID=324617 RepID=UPI001E38881A
PDPPGGDPLIFFMSALMDKSTPSDPAPPGRRPSLGPATRVDTLPTPSPSRVQLTPIDTIGALNTIYQHINNEKLESGSASKMSLMWQ